MFIFISLKVCSIGWLIIICLLGFKFIFKSFFNFFDNIISLVINFVSISPIVIFCFIFDVSVRLSFLVSLAKPSLLFGVEI